MKSIKNARQQWSGVFLCLLVLLSPSVWANCSVSGELEWGELKSVVDGDTLQLKDGRKLRLIAVNTPELGRKGRPDQPLARAAQQAVQRFFSGDKQIGLQYGAESRDRYGRHLVHIFRSDGEALSAHLLRSGFAWQIAIPPNLAYQDCLTRQEQLARQSNLGIWSLPAYQVKSADQLTTADSGFAVVKGTVKKVSKSRSGWWIDLNGISLRLSQKHHHYFALAEPDNWARREVTVRGWIVDRSESTAVKQRGYSPLMMHIQHPSMIVVTASAQN